MAARPPTLGSTATPLRRAFLDLSSSKTPAILLTPASRPLAPYRRTHHRSVPPKGPPRPSPTRGFHTVPPLRDTTRTIPTQPHTHLRLGPTHPLPTLKSLSPTRRWATTLPLFLLALAASAALLFNYQKLNSPVLSATLYALRTDQRVRDSIGEEVYFADGGFVWVWGTVNMVQGRVDVAFDVQGRWPARGPGDLGRVAGVDVAPEREVRRGRCRFRAVRVGGRHGAFRTLEWSLLLRDGTVVDLLEEGGGAAAGVVVPA